MKLISKMQDKIIVFVSSLTGKHFILSPEDILDHSQVKTFTKDSNECLLRRGDQYILFNSYDQLTIFKDPSDIIHHYLIKRYECNRQEEEDISEFVDLFKMRNITLERNDDINTDSEDENADMNGFLESFKENNELSDESPLLVHSFMMIKNPKILKLIVDSSIESKYLINRIIETFHTIEFTVKLNLDYFLSGDRLKDMIEIFNRINRHKVIKDRIDMTLENVKFKKAQFNLDEIEAKLKLLLNGRSSQGKKIVNLIEDILNGTSSVPKSKLEHDNVVFDMKKNRNSIEHCYYDGNKLYMTVVSLYQIIMRLITDVHAQMSVQEINEYLRRGYTVLLNDHEYKILREELNDLNMTQLKFKRWN
jgi:hypothetical protein